MHDRMPGMSGFGSKPAPKTDAALFARIVDVLKKELGEDRVHVNSNTQEIKIRSLFGTTVHRLSFGRV